MTESRSYLILSSALFLFCSRPIFTSSIRSCTPAFATCSASFVVSMFSSIPTSAFGNLLTSGHSGCSSYPVQQRPLCPTLVRAMIMSRRVLVLPTPGGPCTTAVSFCMRRIDWYFALLSLERECAGPSVRSTTSAGVWLGSDQKARHIGSSSSGK